MANNKENERAELHKTIWRIANDLRGSVYGWDFKTYVLGMLFYRFISENLTSYLDEQERKAGTPDFDYPRLSDADAEFSRAETVKEGRLANYQIIAPTTRNFSPPRDGQGTPGPLEQALVGLPAGEGAPPLVQHVVRSFDPCMVCTVH